MGGSVCRQSGAAPIRDTSAKTPADMGYFAVQQRLTKRHLQLARIVGKTVDILFHKVQPPYAPSSISVIHNNCYLCEAFPAETRHFTGDSPVDIMLDTDRQKKPAQEMKATIARIRQSANSILPEKAKSQPTEKNQMYDMTFAPSVEEEQLSMPSSPNNQSTKTRESCVKKGLSFLFGEE